MTLQRYFQFSPSLLAYFDTVDQRYALSGAVPAIPAEVNFTGGTFSGIRSVLWDIYGTLCGVTGGDLDQTLHNDALLKRAAGALISEFSLENTLERLYPGLDSSCVIQQQYVQRIADTHQQKKEQGIEYPEVLIHKIWEGILSECLQSGYHSPWQESTEDTAYRWAYFFDSSLQQMYLYEGAKTCLAQLKKARIIQGIISNAQFYTPLHLQRLLRRHTGESAFVLDEIFDDSLVLFSWELGYSKPNPKAFARAVEILASRKITPEETLYIGNDMRKDILPAKNAGMKTILCAVDRTQTNLRNDDPSCRQITPDAAVTKIRQIPDMLGAS